MTDGWWEDVVRDKPWAIWCPELELGWQPFSADLAAKYSAQGCLVRLVSSAGELDALPEPLGSFPEPNHDAPPFSPQEIVWNERAARFKPESYGEHWEKIRAWVASTGRDPVKVLKYWRRELGEWGGASNLAEMAEQGKRWWRAVPLFDEGGPPF